MIIHGVYIYDLQEFHSVKTLYRSTITDTDAVKFFYDTHKLISLYNDTNRYEYFILTEWRNRDRESGEEETKALLEDVDEDVDIEDTLFWKPVDIDELRLLTKYNECGVQRYER